MKRPQSAVTRVDDPTNSTSKIVRPLSGVTDITHRNSVEPLLAKANYSLQLNNVIDALALYEQAFRIATHHLTSIRLLKLLEDVVLNLVAKLKNVEEQAQAQQILQKLLAWCQIQHSPEDLVCVKCPPLLQARVLLAYADHLRRENHFDDSTHYLQVAHQMLSSYKHDQPIDSLVGQVYLLLSTNSLHRQQYPQAIKEAQSALQHLQQAVLVTNTEDVHENICESFLNLGIAKEHDKLYQEAHYNYYSSLVYAQQNLSEQRQQQIQTYYDQFLSRQATYLQKLTFQKQKSGISLTTSQRKSNQPFIEIVKNMQDTKLSSQFFKKKQKLILSLERKKTAREEKALQKFKPYINKMTKLPASTRVAVKSKTPLKQERQIIQNQGIRILKVSKLPEQFAKIGKRVPTANLPAGSSEFHSSPSPFVQYLERLIFERKQATQLQQFPTIHLPSIEDPNQRGVQTIFSGQMTLYYFQQQSLLYFQYLAQEIYDQFSSKASSPRFLIGMSMNVSDVQNQLSANNLDPTLQRSFLIALGGEYFRYAKIQLKKQCFALPANTSNQFFLYVNGQNVLIQQKNDYESLVFIVETSSEVTSDIQPILQNNRSSKSVLSDDIRPLLAAGSSDHSPAEIVGKNDDIQPILGITEEAEEKVATDYSEDFDYEDGGEDGAKPKEKYDGMEKFTIKIESEDQRQEVIEVYADKQKQQDEEQIVGQEEDEKLNNAVKLIQQKFRSKNHGGKN